MRRILIIDDDRLIHSALRTMLEQKGFAVSVATDGWHGLKTAEADSFDLVLVDIFMPGMDGIETLRALRRSRPATPVIVMSGLHHGHAFAFGASAVPDFLTMAMEFGATRALQKPFTPEEFFNAIESSLAQASEKMPTVEASGRSVKRHLSPH